MCIVLYEFDIVVNVGVILWIVICFGIVVDLIELMGFLWSWYVMVWLGMDYVDVVDVMWYVDWEVFLVSVCGWIVLLMIKGVVLMYEVVFCEDDVLLLGLEGCGVLEFVYVWVDVWVVILM